jgi:uncharacterized membrane protein (DUF373 family)
MEWDSIALTAIFGNQSGIKILREVKNMNKKQTAYAIMGVLIVVGCFILWNVFSVVGDIRTTLTNIEGGAMIEDRIEVVIGDVLPIFILLPLFLVALAYILWREISNDKRTN